MKRMRAFTAKTAAVTLAATMIFSGTALAAPIDELNEIMEAQMTEKVSLLEETLDLSGFSEAKKENGVQIQADFGLSGETVMQMGLEELLPDGGNLSIHTQIDPALKKWLFELALGMSKDASVLDLGLYGDKEKLALSLPQFFAGAVSLHAGNFREQYERSEWVEVAGEMPSDIPEIELEFYPDTKLTGEDAEFGNLEESIAEYGNNIEVEKTEDGDETVYKFVCKSEDLIGIYKEAVDQYMSIFVESGIFGIGDLNDMESDLNQMYDEMADMLGEEVEVLFYVKDNLVERITYGLSVDTSDYVKNGEETESEEPDTILEADESFEGTIDYEIVFVDPQDALKGMDINMAVTDADGTQYAWMGLEYRTETEGTAEKTTVSLELTDEGENVYTGTPFVMAFDAATGDFDIQIEIEEAFSMMLDSTFTEIEKGKSFRWIMDEFSFGDGTDEFAVNGEITVSADPGDIQEPQEERELLAMTQDDIMSFMMEIQMKAAVWAAQFMPEEETEIIEE